MLGRVETSENTADDVCCKCYLYFVFILRRWMDGGGHFVVSRFASWGCFFCVFVSWSIDCDRWPHLLLLHPQDQLHSLPQPLFYLLQV